MNGRGSRSLRLAPWFVGVGLALAATACEDFDPPPDVTLVDAEDGVLTDAAAPLRIGFSEPVVPETLGVKIVRYATDGEGNLFDEDADDATTLDVKFARDPDGATRGGEAVLADDRRTLTITPKEPFPVGGALALLVEPGLEDDAGNATKNRGRTRFAYGVRCGEGGGGEVDLPSAPYFFVIEVEKPVPTQIQLFAWLEVDDATGSVVGQFTQADRIPDPNRCPTACKSTEVCQTIPETACVPPSQRADSTGVHPDFYPNTMPPTGYTFRVLGCASQAAGGAVTFATQPVDTETESPPVKSKGITMSGELHADGDLWAGSGSFAVEEVSIGDTPSGEGQGVLQMQQIPAAEEPEGLPHPAAE